MTPRITTQCEDAGAKQRLETLDPTNLYIRDVSLTTKLNIVSPAGSAAQKGSLSKQRSRKSYLVVVISKSEAWFTNIAFTFSGSRVTRKPEPSTVLYQNIDESIPIENHLRAEQCGYPRSCLSRSKPPHIIVGPALPELPSDCPKLGSDLKTPFAAPEALVRSLDVLLPPGIFSLQ